MQKVLFIGIDGGASKTLGVLIDAAGRVLSSARAAGSAIVGPPSARACEVLAALKQRLCDAAGVAPDAIAGIGLGLNGIDFADEFPQQHAALSVCLGIAGVHLTLVNDGIVALWGASSVPASVIVHHGSGFTDAYRSEYGTERLFDHLDVGRMFDIRYALGALVARMIDGRAAATPLKDAVLRHYGVANEAVYAAALFRQRIPGDRIMTGAAVVFAAWLDRDAAATALVTRAAEDYVCTACAMVRRTAAANCHVAFGGGVIHHAPAAFMALLAERVRAEYPEATVSRPQLSPAHGAALMSAFRHGLDPAVLYAEMARNPAHVPPDGAGPAAAGAG